VDDQARRFAAVALRVGRGISQLERDQVCCGTLTLQQFHTLRTIEAASAITTSALAEGLGIDLSTASRNLAVLEREGLITRARSAEDARVVTVELAAKGTETLRALACDERVIFASLLARIPVGEREAIIMALDRLAAVVTAREPAPSCCPAARPSTADGAGTARRAPLDQERRRAKSGGHRRRRLA
jgi:DNA-binding MarR family transcriptional regulator